MRPGGLTEEDSFCSRGTNRGCVFSLCRSLKILLLLAFSVTAYLAERMKRTGPATVLITVIEPFWRNLHLSRKVLS
jgi:hypothetical protein